MWLVLSQFVAKASDHKQTVESRRKRFREAVEKRLERQGCRSEGRGKVRPSAEKVKV